MLNLLQKANEEFPEDNSDDTSVSFAEILRKIEQMENGPDKVRAVAEFMIAGAEYFSSEQIGFLINSKIQIEEEPPISNLDELFWSNRRISSYLKRFNIKTLTDISLYCPRDTLAMVRGFGPVALRFIDEVMANNKVSYAETKSFETEDRVFVLYHNRGDLAQPAFRFLAVEGYNSIFDLGSITQSLFDKKMEKFFSYHSIDVATWRQLYDKSSTDTLVVYPRRVKL